MMTEKAENPCAVRAGGAGGYHDVRNRLYVKMKWRVSKRRARRTTAWREYRNHHVGRLNQRNTVAL